MSHRLINADCIEAMRELDEASIDAVVCDPPYGLEFMGKEWDGANGFRRSLNIADVGRNDVFGRASRTSPESRAGTDFQRWCELWATEVLRVLKPGGYILAFGGTRTYHRLASGLEDAGFEIRDMVEWLYGSGFPKHASCLKPAHEPIAMGRKAAPRSAPLQIDACRIDGPGWSKQDGDTGAGFSTDKFMGSMGRGEPTQPGGLRESSVGRWPSNVVLDDQAAEQLDEQTGILVSGKVEPHHADNGKAAGTLGAFAGAPGRESYGDAGGASRFFYVAKASSAERNAGLSDFEKRQAQKWNEGGIKARRAETAQPVANVHPTVKPIALMRWLVRLVTPPGGTVLDPFTGSGTTGAAAVLEGFDFIGCEREAEYAAIAQARIDFWAKYPGADVDQVLASDAKARAIEDAGQLGLLLEEAA